jgi:thioredoxin reductase
MTSVTIVGDGPAGLSAALLLAKNDVGVAVFGKDRTRLHGAYLYNYLGIPEIHGSEFVEIAREQCEAFGASLHDEQIVSIEVIDDGFESTGESGDEYVSEYLVVAVGKNRGLAERLGMAFKEPDGFETGSTMNVFDGEVIRTDENGHTSIENAYAGGWATDAEKVQAAIAVGDGARIAMDILSKEAGEPVHDFDIPKR